MPNLFENLRRKAAESESSVDAIIEKVKAQNAAEQRALQQAKVDSERRDRETAAARQTFESTQFGQLANELASPSSGFSEMRATGINPTGYDNGAPKQVQGVRLEWYDRDPKGGILHHELPGHRSVTIVGNPDGTVDVIGKSIQRVNASDLAGDPGRQEEILEKALKDPEKVYHSTGDAVIEDRGGGW